MNRDYILSQVKNDHSATRDRIAVKTPITITIVHSGSKDLNRKSITLKIRDDVNHFSQKDRWSVYFDEGTRRLYFFYGEDVKSYKVKAHKGYHSTRFSCDKLVEIFEKENKPKSVHTIWRFDDEAKMFYAEI